MPHPDSFQARSSLGVGETEYEMFRIAPLQERFDVYRLPYTLRTLLENVLRHEDGTNVTVKDVEAVAGWAASAEPSQEISFTPGRVLLQDFTGVPAVVDLAAMRNAIHDLGGDPVRINPQLPAELVIDHSVQVDEFATRLAITRNAELEFQRNRERYAFLRWGQGAFADFKVVPPSTGIVHQVNLEFLARVVEDRGGVAFPDTLVGTDSHTTMINGLGVLGWGVGGIEAEAAMLGEAISMLVPQVVGWADSRLAQAADVALPIATHAETGGTFVNVERRLQRFDRAFPPPGLVRPGVEVLGGLLERFDRSWSDEATPAGVFDRMAAGLPAFSGLAFDDLPATGTPLAAPAEAPEPAVVE